MAIHQVSGYLILCAVFSAQSAPGAQAETVIRSETRVVQIDVVVKDSNGRPVTKLAKSDFKVSSSGKPREIQIFESQTGAPGDGSAKVPTFGNPAALPPNTYSNKFPAAAPPGRTTAIVLDAINTTFDDYVIARRQVISMIGKLTPGEVVAIYVLYRGLGILQDYTSDHALLLKTMNAYQPPPLTARPVVGRFRNPEPDRTGLADDLTEQMPQQEIMHFVRTRAEDTMAAFRAISSHMAILPGRKSLLWVTGGFASKQLRDSSVSVDQTAAVMNEANVGLYAFDAHPLGSSKQKGVETLQRFADATGGKAYYRRNDIDKAMLEAIEDSHAVYTLGFYLPEDERDGKFHPLKVDVGRRGLDLRYRQGFYAGATAESASPGESQELEAALLSPLESTGIAITAQLKINLTLDPSTVALKRTNDGWGGSLETLVVEKGDTGAALFKFKGSRRFTVLEKSRPEFDRLGLTYLTTVPVEKGTTKLPIVVRDRQSGRVGRWLSL